jgi:glycosyltransferase involved in cell wall biosynthesis
MSKDPYLSVIISAYGSANFIWSTLEAVTGHLAERGWDAEVLPVVDRNDLVVVLVDDFASKHPVVRPVLIDHAAGKGRAIQQGMAKARGEYRCFIDADNGVSFEQIDGAFELIDRYDIVIGSRYREGGVHGKRALSKTIMSRGGNLLFRLILGLDYTDTRAPMKLYRGSVADALFPKLRLTGFGFDTELLFLAKRRGFTVREYPVTWDPGVESTANFRRDAIVSILELFQVRWYWLTGRYRR